MKKYLVMILLFATAPAFAAVPAADTLIAHRGESVDAPENTLPAYRTAVSRGFGFECDIYLSADKRVFTFHDSNLKRTTGGVCTNKCSETSWENTISKIDVGGWGKWKGSKFSPTRPALLEEVLDLAVDGRQIYVEIKGNSEIVPYIKEIFAKQKKATPKNVLFICFNKDVCVALKSEMPEYKVFWLTAARQAKGLRKGQPVTPAEIIAVLKKIKADGVDCQFKADVVTADFVKQIRQAGYEFHAWTIDDLPNVRLAFKRGVQTVTTNCAKKLYDDYLKETKAVVSSVDGLAEFPVVSAPRAVTSGPHEHLLASYFAINSWSPDNRYLLVLETDLNGRLPEADERCTLGLVDTAEGNRFIPVTTTACWNYQEAAMAHWMSQDEILFNDVRDGKFRTVILNLKTKAERVLPMPVSAVSEDHTWAVSINYARLSLTRPDYGYAGPGQDARETVEWPEDDGLWTMNLKTGETKLILSVAQGRKLMPATKKFSDKPGQPLAYYCHTIISKDGEKIFFLARSVDWFDKKTHKIPWWYTTSFTIDRDGANLRRCFKDGWAGSHFNWAPDGSHKLLVTAIWDGDKTGRFWGNSAWTPVEFTVGEEEKVRRIGGGGILDLDWHCVYSPNGKFMSGETYFNKNFERPWVLVRLEDGMTMPLGSFFVPEKYRPSYWRCDLHMRWRSDGRQMAFNSVHEGSRQVYVRDVTWSK